MYEQADRSECGNYLIETNNKQICEIEEEKKDEGVVLCEGIRGLNEEIYSFAECKKANKKSQVSSLNFFILQQMNTAGYVIDVSKDSKIYLELLDGEVNLACDGLVMEYLGNEAPRLVSIPKSTSESTNGYYPSLWKYHLVSDKVYRLIREDTFIVLLPEIYSQSQILMAHAKISHILLSIVNELTGEICNIWLSFDSDYYNKYV